MLAAVKKSKYLKIDNEVLFVEVTEAGSALNYADQSLRKDRAFVLEAINQSDGSILGYINKSLRKDRDIVLAAIKQDSSSFKYADESLRKDKKFILKCIKVSKGKLVGIDFSLTEDQDIQKALKSYQKAVVFH